VESNNRLRRQDRARTADDARDGWGISLDDEYQWTLVNTALLARCVNDVYYLITGQAIQGNAGFLYRRSLRRRQALRTNGTEVAAAIDFIEAKAR